ncbi:MAG: L,D-transpeptidase family protein, partial [Ignavibacteriaceae bacterium]|nr:L,D-transpeptidase family protein [Ignavibacteriaceae bacterium]
VNNSEFSADDYMQSFRDRFNKNDSSFIIKYSDIQYFDSLEYFYSIRNFHPLFIKDFDNLSSLDPLLDLFSKAGEHGIQPALYHIDQIKNELSEISGNSTNKYRNMSNAELLLSDAVLKYAYNLRYGVVDPYKIFAESYFLPVVDSTKWDLLKPLNAENVFEYLKTLQPQNPQYKKLQVALKQFNNIDTSGWKPIKNPGQLNLIAARLTSMGFLDASKIDLKNLNKRDSVFIKAVSKFQLANGLNGDGTVGIPTLEKLNVPLNVYIEKIKLSMERFRWTNYSDSARYILVNIPDFHLHVIDNGREQFEIKVCTGKKKPANYYERLKSYLKTRRARPDDWETPQIWGEISHLVLNPTWTVPPSIIKEEILRETTKDSTYLQRKNFKVFRNGKSVKLADVNLKKFSPNKIPYQFVQDPGAGNALGKIKFMFNNNFGIYLHDTPTRGPFSRSYRAVSHGCVRVEKPFQLAEFLLRNNSKWNLDYIKIETGFAIADKTKIAEFKQLRGELRRNTSIGKTTEVMFDHKIPVFIDYFTAWVSDDGTVNFRADVYDKDKILKKYLFVPGSI